VLSARDGSEVASAPTPPVFFVLYSPAGDLVTFLHAEPNIVPGGPTLVLGALDVASGKAQYVAPGGPLYYAMSKAAPGVIVMHNGFLPEVSYSPDLLDRKTTAQQLSAGPAKFRAPCLGGEAADHAVIVEADGTLVAIELTTAKRSELQDLGDGDAILVSSPDACSLLVVHAVKTSTGAFEQELLLLQAGSAEELIAPRASLMENLTDGESTLDEESTLGGESALDEGSALDEESTLDEGSALPSRRVAQQLDAKAAAATICAFFSPDGKKLLCLEAPDQLESAGDDPRESVEQEGRMRCIWTVWELGDVGQPPVRRAFDPFIPASHFLQTVVPCFDQYALASTPWSPDSSSWCYVTADGTVKVQRLEEVADAGEETAPKRLDTSALGLTGGVLPSPTPEQLAKAAQLGLIVLAPDAETLEAPEAELVVWSPC